ncbi:hypothetical protein A0H81_04195 [Grifola frondosa]|uniref:Uncharacterized protein n=1 Tax=Grifola frondosa TaxID=5627 RepID=A0A1C7MJ88_GRIFR|nr:hypothetical protein A0H81_04195 [Grifola frondosa]
MFYFAYAGHNIPPKRIEFGKIQKNPPGPNGGGTRISITGKTAEEKAVWQTLGEGNEDCVEWVVLCAALNLLDDEIIKAAEKNPPPPGSSGPMPPAGPGGRPGPTPVTLRDPGPAPQGPNPPTRSATVPIPQQQRGPPPPGPGIRGPPPPGQGYPLKVHLAALDMVACPRRRDMPHRPARASLPRVLVTRALAPRTHLRAIHPMVHIPSQSLDVLDHPRNSSLVAFRCVEAT